MSHIFPDFWPLLFDKKDKSWMHLPFCSPSPGSPSRLSNLSQICDVFFLLVNFQTDSRRTRMLTLAALAALTALAALAVVIAPTSHLPELWWSKKCLKKRKRVCFYISECFHITSDMKCFSVSPSEESFLIAGSQHAHATLTQLMMHHKQHFTQTHTFLLFIWLWWTGLKQQKQKQQNIEHGKHRDTFIFNKITPFPFHNLGWHWDWFSCCLLYISNL